jgi:hypothetical protein
MTKIASMTGIPRGTVIGKQVSGPPLSEADHFFKFEMCGDWFDMRDLGAVLDHEQPLPHPACDQAQQRRRIINAASPCVPAKFEGHHEAALGLTHALCLNVAILQSCCQSSTSCPSTNCLAYSIAVSSSGHTSPIARLIRPSLSMM